MNNPAAAKIDEERFLLERVTGIEPVRSAWEADRLPLHHTRNAARDQPI